MQLLRLELKGFKSFADKTIVKFSPGMTAVIGPNGSGKSNITDAMKWVLGESNVRNLRGQKAEDIIFSGTEKRRPMGAAEVTLVFNNSDGQLDIDVTEVAITRRIYRSGESEFQINKRNCRLKDIHMLLADTGLGRDSMAIIGQNRIDAILNSKPEERRLIFEDVAGISRFKLNKEDALRRIATTERNMERIQDVMATIEDQLEPLQIKAETTKKYMVLSRDKRNYDGALGFHQYKTSDRLLTRFENEHISYNDEDSQLQTELSTLDAKRHTLQASTSTDQEQLKQWEAEFAQYQREEERVAGHLRLLEEQLSTARREFEETTARLSELEAIKQGEAQQIQILEQLMSKDTAELQAKESSLGTLESDYQQAMAAVNAEQSQWQAAQDEIDNRQAEHMNLVTSIESNKAAIRSLAERRRETQVLEATLTKEIQDVQVELDAAKHEFANIHNKFTELGDRRKSFMDEEQHVTVTIREQRKELQKLRSDLQKAQGRLELLGQWAEQHEGYLEGTKHVLNGKGPWRSELKGAVGDVFTVNDTFVVAIETALGGSVNHVITTTSRAAAEAVNYLKSTQGGRVTFLPMESVKGRPFDTPALKEPGVLGTAMDCISFDTKYKDIFQYLLGRTLVVESMEQAIQIQKKYHQQLRLVTLTGEQFQPGGSLTGGATKRKRSSVLSRKDEAQRLESDIQKYIDSEAKITHSLQELESRLVMMQEERREVDEQYQQMNLIVVSNETKVDNITNQMARKERVLQEQVQKLAQFDVEQTTLEQAIESTEQALQDLAGDGEVGLNQVERMAKLSALQQAQQEAYEAFTNMRMQCEQLRQNMTSREQQQREREASLASMDERMTPLQSSLLTIQTRLNDTLPQEQQKLQAELETVSAKVQELGKLRDEAYTKTSGARKELEDILSTQEELNKRHKLEQSRLLDMEGKLTRYRMECERAVEELQAMGFTLEEAGQLSLVGSVNDWKDEQARLLAEITELGTVNPNAVEEYEETQNRYDFLNTQHMDLVTAKEQLQAVIAEMDKAMSTQLLEVLDIVGIRFQEVFSKLFGGGTAQIVQTNPDDILTGGIDFYIQPPGKKRQQLSLLSGGERALTVIALLFSFLDYRPAPFCVLDEVDAALDEANVERFSHYLHQVNGETQFIVVSHRKKTMEAAEVLQGVTMVERGVSRLLTVAFEDVKGDLA